MVAVGGVDTLEVLVLRGEAAARSRVDDEEDLVLELREGDLRSILCGDRIIEEAHDARLFQTSSDI